MKVLIDTNVVLDVILERELFVESATALFALIEDNEIQGYIAATTITNIFYVVRKLRGREVALQAISQLLRGLNLCDVGHQVIQQALSIDLKVSRMAYSLLAPLRMIWTRSQLVTQRTFVGLSL